MARKTKGTPADWLVDRILRGLIGLALTLPYHRRVPLMGWLMRRVMGPLAGYRKRAMAHLAHVYPDMPATRRRALADAALDNAGRTVIENYSWRDLAQRLRGVQATGPGLAAVAQARDAGRPVIFVTGHFGNYEAPRHALTGLGHTVSELYKRMDNPYFNEHYVQTLSSFSGPVFEKGRSGTLGFARLLKSGGMATILFDVYHHGGVALPFLGKPAPTTTSPADLALRYDALLVPYFGIRQPDGLGFRVELDAPIAHSDPVRMMTQATQALEARIAAHPEQWFWVHRRWKPHRQSQGQG